MTRRSNSRTSFLRHKHNPFYFMLRNDREREERSEEEEKISWRRGDEERGKGERKKWMILRRESIQWTRLTFFSSTAFTSLHSVHNHHHPDNNAPLFHSFMSSDSQETYMHVFSPPLFLTLSFLENIHSTLGRDSIGIVLPASFLINSTIVMSVRK